jgi:hypothetical protein
MSRIPLVLVLVLSLAPAAVAAPPGGEGPWVLRLSGWTEEDLADLGARFDHIGVYPEKGTVLVHADDREDLDWLLARGFAVEVDRERTATLEKIAFYRSLGVEQIDAIPGFECYRSVEEMLARGAEIATLHPDLAEWVDIGDSWEKLNPGHGGPGYDVQVLRLTNRAIAGPKPALLMTGSTHAREYTTPELVTRFAELLVAGYGLDPDVTWLLDHHRIDLILVQNPDGRKRAETGLLWRKNADNLVCSDTNSRGVDLNRNFDFMWGNSVCTGSSSSQCSETYHGVSAGSEPETQATQAHMAAIFPDQRPDDQTTPAPRDSEGIYLDIHSFGGVVLSSWGCVGTIGPPPGTNGNDICTLGRKVGHFTGYPARIGSTGPVDGSSKDFSYGRLGVPGYTIELGTAFFEECPYFETVILEPNLEALLQTAKSVRTSYLTPWGPDALSLSVPPLPVTAGQPVDVTATVDDTRYGPAAGLCVGAPTPIQTVAGAALYVDVPPWQAGASLPLVAADGAFDETVEEVETSLATGSLGPGRHVLYVQGQDANDDLGAVSAAFLHVIDPATSPILDGVVSERGSGDPLAATVTIGPFEVTTDAGTGAWELQVPPGAYDVTATAPGHAPATLRDVQVAELDAVTVDLALYPLTILLADDVEGPDPGWTAQAPWAITTEASNSPTHSWTDSPGGNYAANADTSLTSPILDLTGLAGTRLAFRHIYDFEPGFDGGAVEVSTDGAAWTRLRTFSAQDQTATWELVELDLPMLDGAAQARIRFRLTADGGLQRDGWHVDDIEISAGPATLLFADGFESADTSAWTTTVP